MGDETGGAVMNMEMSDGSRLMHDSLSLDDIILPIVAMGVAMVAMVAIVAITIIMITIKSDDSHIIWRNMLMMFQKIQFVTCSSPSCANLGLLVRYQVYQIVRPLWLGGEATLDSQSMKRNSRNTKLELLIMMVMMVMMMMLVTMMKRHLWRKRSGETFQSSG